MADSEREPPSSVFHKPGGGGGRGPQAISVARRHPLGRDSTLGGNSGRWFRPNADSKAESFRAHFSAGRRTPMAFPARLPGCEARGGGRYARCRLRRCEAEGSSEVAAPAGLWLRGRRELSGCPRRDGPLRGSVLQVAGIRTETHGEWPGPE